MLGGIHGYADSSAGPGVCACGCCPLAARDTASVFEQRDADHYEHIAEVPTAYRAKSSIFVPDLKRLYVAVSGKGKPDAKLALQIYEVQ